MSVVNLRIDAKKASAKDVYNTTVALFKQQPQSPRVIAESANYLAYTLKNGSTLRLIARENNVKASLKVHTKQIHAVRFVNYRSNVAASASSGEFFVWVVTNENGPDVDPEKATLTVKTYFQLSDPVTICNFSFFINQEVGFPDMLILYDKKAMMLESSKLIQRFDRDTLQASLQTDARELRELPTPATTTNALCSANAGGWFAFTSAPTLVMACTMRNRNTPAWAACSGAAVTGLELLEARHAGSSVGDPAVLITSSAATVFQWTLTGDAEPSLLRTYTFGKSIITLLSCRNSFAVFNEEKEVAVVEIGDNSSSSRATVYQLPIVVRPTSVCFSRTSNYSSVLVDTNKQIDIYQLVTESESVSSGNTNNNGTVNVAKAASPVSDPAILATLATPPPAARPTNGSTSAIQNLLNHVQRTSALAGASATPSATAPPPPAAPPTAAAPAPAPVPPVTMPHSQSAVPPVVAPAGTSATYLAARQALYNAALPHTTDGPLAAAMYHGDEAVRAELESLQNILKNITQIQQLTPDQIHRDHAQLVNLALEAQMTELQNSGVTTARGGATAGNPVVGAATSTSVAAKDSDEAFNSYVVASLMLPIANDIASGVAHGIRDTLRTELDNALRTAFTTSIRESQKAVLKRRLDEALTNTTSFFSNEVAKRLQEVIERDLRGAFAQINASLNSLVEDNRRLQNALNDIMNSNALEEIRALREDVRNLRASVQAGGAAAGTGGAGVGANPSSFQHANPTPETVLTTATAMLAQNSVTEALQYVALAKQPSISLKLFQGMSEDVYSSVVGDASVPDDVWTKLLTQLCTATFPEGNGEDVEKTAEIAFDIISEHNQLTNKSTATAQQLRSDVRHFATRTKGAVQSVAGQRMLRDLEKSI